MGAVVFLDNSGDVLWDHGRSVAAANAVSNTTSAFTTAGYVNLRQYLRGAVPSWPSTTR